MTSSTLRPRGYEKQKEIRGLIGYLRCKTVLAGPAGLHKCTVKLVLLFRRVLVLCLRRRIYAGRAKRPTQHDVVLMYSSLDETYQYTALQSGDSRHP